jgi:hypothetical protein
MYPDFQVETISSLTGPQTEKPVMFDSNKTPHSINEVMAWLMVADGYTAETVKHVLDFTAENWVQKGAITSGWFFGDSTTFNMDFSKEDILDFMRIFERTLLIGDRFEIEEPTE